MSEQNLPTLTYKGASKSAVPIINESELQTITAEPWVKISDEGLQLEGLCFDRAHNLFLCEVFGGKVFRVDLPEKQVSTVFQSTKTNPAAVKIHKNGKLYVCYLGDFESSGGIYAVDDAGNNFEDIINDITTEYCVDDLVFDSKGGF